MTRNQNSRLQDLHNRKKRAIEIFLRDLVKEFRENNDFQKVLLEFHEKKVERFLQFIFRPSDVKKHKEQFMAFGKFSSQIKT